MDGKTKGIIAVVIVLIAIIGILAYAGKINLIPQQVIQTPKGNIDCNSYAECSKILAGQGYNTNEINALLTSCDKSGCKVMP